MGFGSGPKPPSVAMPPPAAHPPVLGSSSTNSALSSQKAQAAAAIATEGDTIATSPQGLKSKPKTANATLLGQ